MKEATGELSSSVIVLSLIAALAAFFFSVLWPWYKEMYAKDESCANAVCDNGYNRHNNGMAYCVAPEDSSLSDPFECPYRG